MSHSTTSRPAQKLQLFAVCAALFALALKQAPNQLVGDTKLDLNVDPARFLRRALHLWDPSGDFGQTQNQSYGYLWPMGPFFSLGHAIGLPAWIVQRVWWGVLLSLAFLGMVKLAERLELGGPFSRLVGGLAFALSPRVLSTIGPISVETLPYCLSPWVLLPLVTGAREGSTRKAAARSAVAVFCMGAVNAAAVLAALPPAVLWLLTRTRGPRRTSLIRWWVGAVILATSWWVVPLALLGKYSPPFLDYIENSSITTSVTSLVEVLRGTSDWVAYVIGAQGPTWPLGSALLTTGVVILYTVVVMAGGVVGLLRRDLPERQWLTLCLLLGVAAVTAGHAGSFTGLFAGTERDLLDGVLAPFRNVHKFDVVLRIPLVLGLVHLVSRSGEADRSRTRARAVQLAALAAVIGAALPVLSAGLAPRNSFFEIPAYWKQTATWLTQHQQQGSALLLPGSNFPDYLWGSTNDEPLQVLAGSRWEVRGAVPLTPGGTIRYLDALEARLASGRSSVGLADDLARAGIHYLVVRNDLAYGAASATRPLLLHEAVATSPGIARVATFGGLVGGGNLSGYIDEGLEVAYPAIEIYEVVRLTPIAQLSLLSQVVRVSGGPESLLPLDDRFLLKGRPTVLEAQASGAPADAPTVLTDGLKRREVFFGGAQNQSTSPTLTTTDPYRVAAPAHDYVLPGEAGHQTVARLLSARQVDASSSASDALALGGAQRSHLPYAAVDSDPLTSWRSDAGKDVAHTSWRLAFDSRRTVAGLTVRFDVPHGGKVPTAVRVSTDHASTIVQVPPDSRAVAVTGLVGSTSSLTITTARTTGVGLGYLGLADVRLPGLAVSRTLDTAHGRGTPVIVLDADDGDRSSCFLLLTDSLCSTTVGSAGAESSVLDRTLHLDGAGAYRLFASAVPVAGAVLNGVLDDGTGVAVTASSSALSAPASRPGTVIDGDLGTGWRAAPGDPDPALTVTYRTPQTVTGLRVQVQQALASGRARAVRIDSAAGSREGRLDARGRLSFAPLTATSVTVRLRDVVPATSLDPYSITGSLLPVGVSELSLEGAVAPTTPAFGVAIPCGAGPVLRVGDALLQTSVSTDRASLQKQDPVTLVVCGSNTVDVGDGTRIVAPASTLVRPVSLTLRPAVGDALAQPAQPDLGIFVTTWSTTKRAVSLPERSEPTLLRVHENTNPGWVARLGERRLAPVVVDGWQQGWVVPAGKAATVRLVFAPDRTFRLGLIAGALGVLALLVLALLGGSSELAPATAAASTGVAGLGAVVLLLIGGPVGLGLGLAGLLVRSATLKAGAAALALLGAGALLAHDPWPTSYYAGRGALPQVLCEIALGLLWSMLVPRKRLSFRRSAGRSTTT